MANYQTKAPLPFVGQKRAFLKHYVNVLNEIIADDGQDWVIVDAFGGSGLLSHVAKRVKPQATVIYNDFDHYRLRLDHIHDTNRLRRLIAQALSDYPRYKYLSTNVRGKIVDTLKSFEGYIDYHSLSSWLLFSGEQAKSLDDFLNKRWYNGIRKNDYSVFPNYLDGLIITHEHYEDLLPCYLDNPKCLLVLDPPYICTTQGSYAHKNYFGMVEFLNLMRYVRPPFCFFSSTRSELVDYFDFVITKRQEGYQKIEEYQRLTIQSKLNYTSSYEDNLLYKKASP